MLCAGAALLLWSAVLGAQINIEAGGSIIIESVRDGSALEARVRALEIGSQGRNQSALEERVRALEEENVRLSTQLHAVLSRMSTVESSVALPPASPPPLTPPLPLTPPTPPSTPLSATIRWQNAGSWTVSNGGLTASFGGGGSYAHVHTNTKLGSAGGKWYMELTIDTWSSMVGISSGSGSVGGGDLMYYRLNLCCGSLRPSYGITMPVSGDVFGIALDMDASATYPQGSVTYYLNGVSQGVIPVGSAAGAKRNVDFTQGQWAVSGADHTGSSNSMQLTIHTVPQYPIPTGYQWW